MWTMSPVIVFIMLFVPLLCDDPPDDGPTTLPPLPDWGSPEEFLKEVNEYRAKFAKERKMPNMYKLVWSNELVSQLNWNSDAARLRSGLSRLYIPSYRNPAEWIDAKVGNLKNLMKIYDEFGFPSRAAELINPLHTFIGCFPELVLVHWMLECSIGFTEYVDFRYVDPGEAGSQCPPRFKAENGLCVPKDPSKHTFWGTEEGLLEDVNYMRRKYAKKFGIPNMHQLTWNDSLVEVLKHLHLDVEGKRLSEMTVVYPSSSDPSGDGFGKNWRITDLLSFSAGVAAIDEAVHNKFVLNRKTKTTAEEFIHPLQTSIGCMKKEVEKDGRNFILTTCLLGNMGQWPSDWKIDVNSTKIPGSECMDGYANDDGLCVLAPPATAPKPISNVPKKPEVTGASESEQEEAESSSTTKFSYGLWILYLFLSFFLNQNE